MLICIVNNHEKALCSLCYLFRGHRSGHLFTVLCGIELCRVHHCHHFDVPPPPPSWGYPPPLTSRGMPSPWPHDTYMPCLHIDRNWNDTHQYSIGRPTFRLSTWTAVVLCWTTTNTFGNPTLPVNTLDAILERRPLRRQPASSWTRRRTDDHLRGQSRFDVCHRCVGRRGGVFRRGLGGCPLIMVPATTEERITGCTRRRVATFQQGLGGHPLPTVLAATASTYHLAAVASTSSGYVAVVGDSSGEQHLSMSHCKSDRGAECLAEDPQHAPHRPSTVSSHAGHHFTTSLEIEPWSLRNHDRPLPPTDLRA